MSETELHKRHQELVEAYSDQDMTAGLKSLLYTLAALELEEKELQQVVLELGTTYVVTGDKGQQYTRPRPEWIQLDRTRSRKLAALTKLRAERTGTAERIEAEIEQFFS